MRERRVFQSMGCEVAVVGARASEYLAIERLFAERDRIFSRFDPESELNRVNAAAGKPIRVSRVFAELLGVALEAARETGGMVDPTLGAEIEAAGYNADFSLLEESPHPPQTVAPRQRVTVQLDERCVHVPKGVRLDLNGVVKGRTVDDALSLIKGSGFVAAGGDLAAKGTFVVALPGGGTISLVRGALATSGTNRRRWIRNGLVQHHLIDPSSGIPASSRWEQVTVCGMSCVGADVAAKTAFLLSSAGPKWLDARDLPGRFITSAGKVVLNHAWQRSLVQTLCI